VMIAIDSSSLIAYLAGEEGEDIDAVEMALGSKQAMLPPVVLCELLSDPELPVQASRTLKGFPMLPVIDGFWERVGLLRAKVIRRGLKARLADTLIAQSCLDHELPLITRDQDFRHFARAANLKLLP
jgi:predicted nucleic acid-binding protein